MSTRKFPSHITVHTLASALQRRSEALKKMEEWRKEAEESEEKARKVCEQLGIVCPNLDEVAEEPEEHPAPAIEIVDRDDQMRGVAYASKVNGILRIWLR